MPSRPRTASLLQASRALLACALVALARPVAADGRCLESAAVADFVRAGDELTRTDLEAAIRKYEAARETAPSDPRIIAKLAAAHEKREAWERALRTWGEASALAPGHAGYAFGTVRALIHLERWPEALEAASATLSIDAGHVDAHVAFADIVMHLYDRPARDREAATHLRTAVELRPDESRLYQRLGDHLFRAGFPSEAQATLRAGLLRAADERARFPLRLSLAEIARAAGDEPERLTQLEAAKAACGDCREPSEALLPYLLGAAYAQARPSRKTEAAVHLSSFMKRICKGAAAARHRDACVDAAAMMSLVAPVP